MARYCRMRISSNRHGRGDMVRLNAREKGMRQVGTAMATDGKEGERVERGRENESGWAGKGKGVGSEGTQWQWKVLKGIDLGMVGSSRWG
jgi:hypothetical protein